MIRTMLYLLTAAYIGTRRALARDQGKPEKNDETFGRLLVGEVSLLSSRVGRWRVTTISLLFFGFVLVAEIALTELTPGPVMSVRWRVFIALLATVAFLGAWTVTHAIRSAGWKDPRRAQRVTAGTRRRS